MHPPRRLFAPAAAAALLLWALASAAGIAVAAEPRAAMGMAAAESPPIATPTAETTGSRPQEATAGQQSAASLPDRTVSLATAAPLGTFSDVPGLCPVITDVLFETCRSSPQESFCQP